MSYKLKQVLIFAPTVLILLLYFASNNFELYPRVGWVDAGMYTGYANNYSLIKDYGFAANNYQGTRLGYVIPARLFSNIFDPLLGRYLFVLFFFTINLIALIIIVRRLSKNLEIQSLILTVIICNPLLLAGISYGGADGPTASYIILYATFLFLSAYKGNYSAYLGLAGVFAALGLSTHLLAIAPIVIITISYFIFQPFEFKRKIVFIGFGFFLMIICLSVAGYYLDIEQNYLTYSLSWGVRSIQGGGGIFSKPVEDAIWYFPIYIPPVILFLITPKLLDSFKSFKSTPPNRWALVAMVLSVAPLLFFFLFDNLLGGSISQYLPYYQLFYPCFIFSFAFIVTHEKVSIPKEIIIPTNIALAVLFIFSIYNVKIQYSLLFIATIFLLMLYLLLNNEKKYFQVFMKCLLFVVVTAQYLLYSNNNSVLPFFHMAGNANSKELYKSQLKFMSSVGHLPRAYGLPLFIYDSDEKIDVSSVGQFYYTYFNGKRNNYTYFDSLLALYLWDRSILISKPYSEDLRGLLEVSDHSRQIVILGRNKSEVSKLYNRVQAVSPKMRSIDDECNQSNYYPWCILVVKRF